MKRVFVIYWLLLLTLSAVARSDFDDAPSSSPKTKDDIASELEETSDGENTVDHFARADISRSEMEALSRALKTRSEAGVVQAASVILGKDPTHLKTLNALGLFYFQSKKYGLAKIIFRRALRDHKSEPALYNNLGVVYLAEGDLRLALENFRKSIQAKSGYKIGATNLSSIYLDHRDYKRSLSPLEEAFEASRSDLRRGDGEAVEIANNYGVALMGLGEDGKARRVFEQIVESGTRNPAPHLNYIILLVEVQKKKNDAIRAISKLKFITEDREILRQVQELEKKLE